MSLTDSTHRYGAITKLLHWSIALLITFQYLLVYWKHYMLPKGSELGGFLIAGLHKPLGVVILGLAVGAILWRCCNHKPNFPTTMAIWQRLVAKSTHYLLYLAMLIMPISGIIMTAASGYTINMFGLYKLSMAIEPNKVLGKFMFDLHETTSCILLALILLHFVAALEHHFLEKDDVLKRMLTFGK